MMRPELHDGSFYPTSNPWDFVVDDYDLGNLDRRLWINDKVYGSLAKNLFNGCGMILDVSCGAGALSLFLVNDFKMVSLDFSESMLKKLKGRARELRKGNPSLVQADSQKLPFKNGSFDGTFCKFGLSAVRNPGIALAEMIRVTRSNGKIIIIEADRTKPCEPSSLSKWIYRTYRHFKNRPDHDLAWERIIEMSKRNNSKLSVVWTKEVLTNCGCTIRAEDTSIRTKTEGIFGKIGCRCNNYDYFLVCAEKSN